MCIWHRNKRTDVNITRYNRHYEESKLLHAGRRRVLPTKNRKCIKPEGATHEWKACLLSMAVRGLWHSTHQSCLDDNSRERVVVVTPQTRTPMCWPSSSIAKSTLTLVTNLRLIVNLNGNLQYNIREKEFTSSTDTIYHIQTYSLHACYNANHITKYKVSIRGNRMANQLITFIRRSCNIITISYWK